MKIPLWAFGVAGVAGLVALGVSRKIKSPKVMGRQPGTSQPGLYIVNADKSEASRQAIRNKASIPPGAMPERRKDLGNVLPFDGSSSFI